FRFAVCEIHRLSWASRLRTGASPSQCAHAPCHTAAAFARRGQRGTPTRRGRWPREPGLSEVRMADNRARNGNLSALLGLLVALAAIVFLLNGGEYVGKKTVATDEDLPPVATGQQPR